jgi:hypothetical protein
LHNRRFRRPIQKNPCIVNLPSLRSTDRVLAAGADDMPAATILQL